MLYAPPQPHVPHVSHLPHLLFLLHLPCPITWVHTSRLDHGMPPLLTPALRQHVTTLVLKLFKWQASVLVHHLPSQFLSPLIPPRHLNLNLSRSYWEKT